MPNFSSLQNEATVYYELLYSEKQIGQSFSPFKIIQYFKYQNMELTKAVVQNIHLIYKDQ